MKRKGGLVLPLLCLCVLLVTCSSQKKEEKLYAEILKSAGEINVRMASACISHARSYINVMEYARVTGEELSSAADKILGREYKELKEQLKDKSEERRKRRHGIYIDVGERIQDYIGDAMEGIAEGIQGELEKSIFIGPHGRHIKITSSRANHERDSQIEKEDEPVNFEQTAKVISALGQEHRLAILKELISGGKYVNELQEQLSEIAASTLSSHLNVLEEAGLIVQERVRGRYLITIPGRSAYKMAKRINSFLERKNQE